MQLVFSSNLIGVKLPRSFHLSFSHCKSLQMSSHKPLYMLYCAPELEIYGMCCQLLDGEMTFNLFPPLGLSPTN